MTLLLHNLELPAGEQAVTVSVDGPLAVSGAARLAATLAPGAQALPFTTLTATGAGRGIVRLDVVGTGGFHIQRETAITVRPARGATTMVAAGELAPGAEMQIAPPLDQFVAGTWKATASFGGAVRYDVAGLVQALDRYPLWCLEQATSRGFPLRCCRMARWRGRTGPHGCNRRWASCSTGSASTAASACGRRRPRRSRGSRSTRPNSCCGREMPAPRFPNRR